MVLLRMHKTSMGSSNSKASTLDITYTFIIPNLSTIYKYVSFFRCNMQKSFIMIFWCLVMNYSGFKIFWEGLTGNKGWKKAWKGCTKKYDVIIIGGGGHGLSTAYYLSNRFNVNNVAVLEKVG